MAITEHGAIVVASVLNSERAIDMSVYVVRAFVQLHVVLLDRQLAYWHCGHIKVKCRYV